MCGGTLEIATCSHVGHVFRKSTPYTFPGGTSKIVNHNNARLAEVWLDQWKYFYYNINPGSTNTNVSKKKERQFLYPIYLYFINTSDFFILHVSFFWVVSMFLQLTQLLYGFGILLTSIRYPFMSTLGRYLIAGFLMSISISAARGYCLNIIDIV